MNHTSPVILICTWFSRLVWINFCWLFFTLLGGGVFGIFPATTSALQMTRRYLNGASSISFKTFFIAWKAEVVPVNKSVLPLVIIASSLIWHLVWSINNGNQFLQLMSLALLPVIVFNFLILIAVLIQTSVFEGSTKQQWRLGLKLMSSAISLPIFMLVTFSVFLMGSLIMPILALMFLISPACLITMVWYLHRFPEHKQLGYTL